MNLTINRKAKIISALSATFVLCLLASCSSTSVKPMGGAASIAQAQANATATAEVAATSTAMVVEAQRRLDEAYARSTQIAMAGVQSTLTAQDQQINDLVIAGARAQLTAQADAYKATATAVAIQRTAEAANFMATATAVADAAISREMGNRTWGWIGLIIVLALAIFALLLIGWIVLLGWKYFVHHSSISNPNGPGGVIVKLSPIDLLRGYVPEYELLLPATPNTPSANPQLEAPRQYEPMVIRKMNGQIQDVVNRLDDTIDREIDAAWARTRERMVEFCQVVFAYARENAQYDLNVIPRWDSLNGVDGHAMNTELWTEMTSLLEEQEIINPKRQGKPTTLNPDKCKTVVDLALLATRDKILPPHPTSGWKKMKKWLQNSTEQHSSEQSKQSEQSSGQGYVQTNLSPDDPVWALPGVDR